MIERPPRRILIGLMLAVAAITVPAVASTVVVEKSVNLDIARRVEERLKSAGVIVSMTRTTDRTVSLRQRTDLADNLRVDAFVSIHNNASSSPSASGSIVFHQIASDRSLRLADAIHDALRRLGSDRPDRVASRRGDHGDYYFQLRETTMPAVIVEGAFLTNPVEGPLLARSPTYRQQIADAIADGILVYQRTLVRAAAPSLDPGTVVPSPLPAPTDGAARALGATRVALGWTAGLLGGSYRVYRDGRLIAGITATAGGARMMFTDPWAAPGQTYRYEIRSVQHVTPDLSIEGASLTLTARTPAMSIVLDPGHGGADPGAIARY